MGKKKHQKGYGRKIRKLELELKDLKSELEEVKKDHSHQAISLAIVLIELLAAAIALVKSVM